MSGPRRASGASLRTASARSGRGRRRSRPAAPRSSSAPMRSTSVVSTSAHGQYARRATRLPAPTPADLRARVARARSVSSAARRDLPMPGSPADEEQAPAARPMRRRGRRRALRSPPPVPRRDRHPRRESGSARQRRHEVQGAGPHGVGRGRGREGVELVHGGVDLRPGGGRRSGDAAVRADDAERLLELGALERATEQVAQLAAGAPSRATGCGAPAGCRRPRPGRGRPACRARPRWR